MNSGQRKANGERDIQTSYIIIHFPNLSVDCERRTANADKNKDTLNGISILSLMKAV